MSSFIFFTELLQIRYTLFRPRVTSGYVKVNHAMASPVTMTCVLLVISELTKEELITTLISVRSVLQVLYTPHS